MRHLTSIIMIIVALGLAGCASAGADVPATMTPVITAEPAGPAVTATPAGTKVAVTTRAPAGETDLATLLPEGAALYRQAEGDLDGDGRPEIVLMAGYGGSSDRLGYDRLELLILTLADEGYQVAWRSEALAGDRAEPLKIWDVNVDGRPEIVSIQSMGAAGETLQIFAWLGDTYGVLAPHGGYFDGADHFGDISVSLDDVDRDGRVDILAGYGPGASEVDAYRWDGTVYAYVEPSATAEVPSTDLTVEEYPVVSEEVDSPSHLEYWERIDPQALDARGAWRAHPPGPDLEVPELMAHLNDILAPFDYRLEARPGAMTFPDQCDLYRGDSLIESGLTGVRHISVSASGADFAFMAERREAGPLLIRKDSIEPRDPSEHFFTAPVFVGDDLVMVGPGKGGKDYAVWSGDELLYPFEAEFMVSNPIKGLWSWDGHWVLEVDGQVVIDGQNLNEERGYDEVFHWRLLKGRPFYFFIQDGRVGVSYAGEVLPQTYDQVIHYQCCEPAMFNPGSNDTMVWFHALRDGTWYYVEMGVYE